MLCSDPLRRVVVTGLYVRIVQEILKGKERGDVATNFRAGKFDEDSKGGTTGSSFNYPASCTLLSSTSVSIFIPYLLMPEQLRSLVEAKVVARLIRKKL